MPLLDNARFIARSVSFEVPRYFSERAWKRQFVNQLKSRQVDAVFDVGANSGQYAMGLRKRGYTGRIASFEPLSGPFSDIAKQSVEGSAVGLPAICPRRCDGTISINVAGNAGESSSVLPMLKSHQDVFPAANYIGTEKVPIHRLDSVAPEILRPTDMIFLKIDVQGFEKQVLAGGKSTVNDRCVGMQLELSFLPLYEGGMLIREALDLAYSLGFTLTGMLPVFHRSPKRSNVAGRWHFFRDND